MTLFEEALERVLEVQTSKILEDATKALDALIKLEELGDATTKLAKGKVPGRDGIPVEFYLVVWDHIGPILLEVLIREGLLCGSLHPHITKGIIILLKKKWDQLLLHNKRGLMLLNCVLKFLTKLY